MSYRDTEDSAPAEFPPEQPEADLVEDDGTAYGAEEEELEEELKEETKVDGEDEEMAGADDTAGPSIPVPVKEVDEDEESDAAGSEDLEAESSGSDEEDLEEEVEGEGDEDMEMAEDGEHATAGPSKAGQQSLKQQPHGEVVMVH